MNLKSRELGQFLAARRSEITPEQVGLPAGARRRPGLRREEVALLAGVGASWYQWIEQGRAKNVSREILEAISGVLRLDPVEHRYVMNLAGVADFERAEPGHDELLMSQVVGAYLPNPAYVVDRYWNVLSANAAMVRLLGLSPERKNYLRMMCAEPSFKELFVDWEQAAADAIARFRAHTGNFLGDPELSDLIADLRTRSEVFARLWEDRSVSDGSCTVQEMRHAELGSLNFTRVSLDFTCQSGFRLVLLTSDEATRSKIAVWGQAATPREYGPAVKAAA
ncbi:MULTISPECIES: helix-turn-helix transcriptional regulator [unclassified Streptomyces]|uniref:helix-turn-helix transcriptional regulator n=1 Tax=unclassified Streptomyces TaxID=2593676 RepID=UPI00381EA851